MAPLTQEHREAISRGQIERYRRAQKAQDHFAVTSKRCTKCREVKRVPEDYSMRKRVLKSGEIKYYPAGECLSCAGIRREAWKRKFIEEHGIEAWRSKQRLMNASRDPEKKKRYNRQYSRERRREAGVPERGPWKRYRDDTNPTGKGKKVTAAPALQWWNAQTPSIRQHIRRADESLHVEFHAISRGDRLNIDIVFLDRLSVVMGDPSLVGTLSLGVL